jgi:hypothetical protein
VAGVTACFTTRISSIEELWVLAPEQ